MENLALSPDERTLAFHAREKGKSSIMLIPTAGGPARPLLTIEQPEVFPFWGYSWTPDSKHLVSARNRENVGELWLVPVDGSAPRRIHFPRMGALQSVRMNPDGKTVAFVAGGSESQLWVAEHLLPPRQ
jgi:Tol biopolymer transport system component